VRGTMAWRAWAETAPDFRALIDASNCVLLFLTVFGLYHMGTQTVDLAASVAPSPASAAGMTGRARDFNWHNAIGLLVRHSAGCDRVDGNWRCRTLGPGV